MKIALFVGGAKYPPIASVTVSGHVQVAIKTADILRNQGHELVLITTETPSEYCLPQGISWDGIRIETVARSTGSWPNHRANLSRVTLQFWQLYSMLHKGHWDVLHFVGTQRTATLLGLLSMLGVRGRSVATLVNYRLPTNIVFQVVQKRAFAALTSCLTLTGYIRDSLLVHGYERVFLTRPGVLKQRESDSHRLSFREESKGYVLFWRNANRDNGADICARLFKQLSHEFQSYDFVFAVRSGDEFERLLRDLARQYKNIHLLCYPYERGMTISQLLSSALCVVLPFRRLSMHPQLSVLETLYAGKPLITTNVGSNPELIVHGKTGYLNPPDDIREMYSQVQMLLEDPALSSEIGELARSKMQMDWNWESYARALTNAYECF